MVVSLAVLPALSGVVTRASAQATDPVAAESLFEEGRQLMQAGHYAEACPKLEASQRLDPGVGTLLNLGDCLERSGRTASAWERFREAASAAVAAGQREREVIARGRVDALAPKLCRLRVNVSNAARVEGVTVTRDGALLDRAVWGEVVPVDPGSHAIAATAAGKRPWSAPATLDAATCAGTTQTVDVPMLENDPSAMVSPAPLPVLPPSPPPPHEQETTRWGLQRQLALSAAGLAVVAAGIGTGLAVDARSTYVNDRSDCTPRSCTAGTLADYATGAFVIAGVAAAAGLTLWFTAPSRAVTIAPQAALLGHGGVGVAASGSWP
jgi:hypothetical protein